MQALLDSLHLTDAELNRKIGNKLLDSIAGKPGYVYYLQIYHIPTKQYIYKIGFTSYSVEHRIRDLLGIKYPRKNITIVKIAEVKFNKATIAYRYEQKLHRLCRHYNIPSYARIPDLLQNGMSELYNCDVLGLIVRSRPAPYLTIPHRTVLIANKVVSKPIKEKSPAMVRSQLYCKCTREHLRLSPEAHVESCPRFGIPLAPEAITARQCS
jgi:hypothetical protein